MKNANNILTFAAIGAAVVVAVMFFRKRKAGAKIEKAVEKSVEEIKKDYEAMKDSRKEVRNY